MIHESFASIEFFQIHIPEPHILSVILKTNVAGAGEIFEGGLEFVAGSVGVFVAGGPVIEVGVYYLFAIDAHSDLGAFAGDDEAVPLADRFGGISAGREGIVERAVIMLAEFCFACGVKHLNLKPALHRILRVRAEKDTAVAAR